MNEEDKARITRERAEGVIAFTYGGLRDDNPYVNEDDAKATEWCFGWDYARNRRNGYDFADRVQKTHELRANGLKIAAYRVRDEETGLYGKLQFHMTWDNTVLAMMSEEAAKLFARFVRDTPEPDQGAVSAHDQAGGGSGG